MVQKLGSRASQVMGNHCPDLVTGSTRDHAFGAAGSLVLSGLVLLGAAVDSAGSRV